MIHLDTSYLVDLLREGHRPETGSATRLLRQLANEELAMSACVLCELRAGAELAQSQATEHESVDFLEQTIAVAPVDSSTAVYYGRVLAYLKRRGEVIAAMDLMIASASLAAGASLVTRDRKHFDRVPGLQLIEY